MRNNKQLLLLGEETGKRLVPFVIREEKWMKLSIQTFCVGASVTLEIEVQSWRKNSNELRYFIPL